MLKIINYNNENYRNKLKTYLDSDAKNKSNRVKLVSKIINEIREGGDKSLLNLTKKYDKNNIKNIKEIEVSKQELENSVRLCSKDFLKSTRVAIERIKSYQKKLLPKNLLYKDKIGIKLGCIWKPIDSCGLYIPGGKAIYPSSVLMNAVAAKLAGVKRIVLVSPAKNKKIRSEILASAKLSGVNKVFMIGGAQAIAALTYGTETIEKVDKIFGPGNAFVAEAKKQVFGDVGIDSIAGPSEVMVIADKKSNPEWIAVDLLSQAEHDEDARAILVSDSLSLIQSVNYHISQYLKTIDRKEIAKVSIKKNGLAIKLSSLKIAHKIVNFIAPEHLQIITKDCKNLIKKINNAGAIFVGNYTPEAFGDYLAGPSHVLPTAGNARFESGLSVIDFFKRTSYLEANKMSFARVAADINNLARVEGLTAHALSATIRYNKGK